MNLHHIRLELPSSGDCEISAQVEFAGGSRSLWYRFDAAYSQFIDSYNYDAFVIGLILEAMYRGEEITVQGPVSAELLVGLRYYMHVMRTLYPQLKLINLRCRSKLPPRPAREERHTISNFSCGIDSFCTLLENQVQPMPDGDRVSHLLFANVGSHGRAEAGEALFRKRLPRIRAAAADLYLPLLVVNSNLDGFYSLPFETSHCARTVSCVLLFQSLFQRHLVPSTNAYADFGPDGSMPVADHLLSTNATRVIHDGAQYSRIEKSRRIAKLPPVRKWLYVCTRDTVDGGNCSECDKCVRAMLTFDLLGVKAHFESVFDYSHFTASKARYIEKMNRLGTAAPNFYWKEIVEYARASGYRLG